LEKLGGICRKSTESGGKQVCNQFCLSAYCSAFGETEEEALREVLKAKAAWLETAQAENRTIPEPRYRPAIYQVAS
jgi:predicted RNase H-like HicB family nuclease